MKRKPRGRDYRKNTHPDRKDHTFTRGECKWCGMREGWQGAADPCQMTYKRTMHEKRARDRAATTARQEAQRRPQCPKPPESPRLSFEETAKLFRELTEGLLA